MKSMLKNRACMLCTLFLALAAPKAFSNEISQDDCRGNKAIAETENDCRGRTGVVSEAEEECRGNKAHLVVQTEEECRGQK